MAKKVKLKGAGKPSSQNPETLKEATVYADPRMKHYLKAFDLMRSGRISFPYANPKEQKEYGKRMWNALQHAETYGYANNLENPKELGPNLVDGLYEFRADFNNPNHKWVFNEKYYPDYVKEGLAAGLELDFAIHGVESDPLYVFKRPMPEQVKAEPKTIESSRPNLKLRKPVEEEILDINYTQGGDKVKVSTNFGEQVMSRQDYVDFYKKFKDKIQSFRTAKKVRRK